MTENSYPQIYPQSRFGGNDPGDHLRCHVSPQQVFSIANSLALVSWIMLAILTGRPWVTKVVTTKLVPGLFAILYTAIAVSLFWHSPGGFSTLASVGVLFSNPWLLLAGWVHYLAFDLLIGSWELEDSRERGIPHLMVVPCLLLTFMFGPAGWLLYRIVRSVRRRDSIFPSKEGAVA